MVVKVFLVCLVLKIVIETVANEVRDEEGEYCYNREGFESTQYNQFGTKTAYVKIKETLNETRTHIDGCDPAKIWLLSRHGAANPSDTIMSILEKLEDTRDKIAQRYEPDEEPETEGLCIEDLEKLKAWKWDEERTNHAEVLANEGLKELQTLAVDYKAEFTNLFNPLENVLFRHTNDSLSKESLQGFADALFEPNAEIIKEAVEDTDLLLKFHKHCVKWQDNKNKQNESDSQLSKFQRSSKFSETVQQISERLKLADNFTIEDVFNIWDMCRLDKAWNNTEKSPWCAAFEPNHINILEHREDLKYHFESGYGAEINRRVACKTVVDMITHLQDDKDEPPKTIANFADETTIQLLLTALGVDEDMVSPSDTNFNDESEGTRWRSSKVSPFAANIAVVKYNCSDAEYRVKFFLNQRPIKFEWCVEHATHTCTLSEVVEAYRTFKDADCEDYFCSGEVKMVYGVLIIVVNLILIYLY